jgi:8-oxo-dGTP diphosphatase
MEVVRAFYQAVNRGDAVALAAMYAPDCTVEQPFANDESVIETRQEAARAWAAELTRAGTPDRSRVDVSRIAGIETGWGWVRADWVSAGGRGYAYFWIEDGLIRRHRTIRQKDVGRLFQEEADGRTRAEKDARRLFPVVGIGAVIVMLDRQVVLVKRKYEPLAGQWSLPGGGLELGESLEAGVAREVLEETGLIVDVGPVVDVFDRILLDDDGQVRFHFVLVDYLCRPRGGRLQAGSDVEAVTLADPAGLTALRVTEKAQAVVLRALDIMSAGDHG